MEVNNMLRDIYEQSGLSMAQIAENMGCGKNFVHKLMNRKRPHNPAFNTIRRFARACGYSMTVSFNADDGGNNAD